MAEPDTTPSSDRTDRKVDGLDYRVTGLEKTVASIDQKVEGGFRSLGDAIGKISGKGTNWSLLTSMAGLLFTFTVGIGTIVYKPLADGQARSEAAIQRLGDAGSSANGKLAEALDKIVDKVDGKLDGKASREAVLDLRRHVDELADKTEIRLDQHVATGTFEAWKAEDERRREDWQANVATRLSGQWDAIRHLNDTTISSHDLDARFASLQHEIDRVDAVLGRLPR